MASVKSNSVESGPLRATAGSAVVRADEVHAAMLMGLLMREIQDTFAAEDWSGLRQSHFRVISCVPPEGVRVTDLGERVGMTKQGCGQFVTQLVASGHLRIDADPDDRRVRLVQRTPLGDNTIAAVTERNLRIEHDWAERVGERRYRTFRKVMEDLTVSPGADSSSRSWTPRPGASTTRPATGPRCPSGR